MKKRIIVIILLLIFSCTSVRKVRNFALRQTESMDSVRDDALFRKYYYVNDQPVFPLYLIKQVDHHSGVAGYPLFQSGMIILSLRNGKTRFLRYPSGKGIGEIKLAFGMENEIVFLDDQLIVPNSLGNFALRVIRFPELKEVAKIDEIPVGNSFSIYRQYAIYVNLSRHLKIIRVDNREALSDYELQDNVSIDPVVKWNRIILISENGGLYVFSLHPFRLEKRENLDGIFISQPMDMDSALFFISKKGKGFILDKEANVKLLKKNFPSVVSSPAFHPKEKILVIGSLDHTVYAYSWPDLNLKWTFQTKGIITCNPVVMNKHIIIASWDGHVYFLDLKGQLIHSINVETPVTGSLLWHDRYLYFDTLKKGFFIYGETKFQ